MARKDLELELLNLRFKYYTSEVRQCISDIVTSQRCEDTSDTVIDGLWERCPDDMAALLAKNGIDDPSYDEQDESKPSTGAREVIRTYIDQARSFEAELGDLDGEDFEALYRTIIDPHRQRKTRPAHAGGTREGSLGVLQQAGGRR